jgi:hypothetical protein
MLAERVGPDVSVSDGIVVVAEYARGHGRVVLRKELISVFDLY